MNFTRNEFALYIACVAVVFVTSLLLIDATFAHRLVAGAVYVGILLVMRWVANTYSDEARAERLQRAAWYWRQMDAR